MRCQPDRRCSKFGMAIAAHSISTAGFDPLLYVFGADHTLRFVFFSHRSATVYRIAKGEEGSAQILKKPASLFSPALLSGWTPRRMLLKWLHPPADTRSFVFVETGAFLDRPSQERAPVPDANAMKRSMYCVASVGDHSPCWIDCFKALPTVLCSIFWNIST